MEDVALLFQFAFNALNIEFVICGFPLSMWDVFLWSSLVAIVARIIWGFLDG